MNLQNVTMTSMMIVIVGSQLISGILIFAYTSRQQRSGALNFFLLSKLLQPVAWIPLGLRAYMDGWLIIAAANSLLFAVAALELSAILILKDYYTPKVRKRYLSLLAGGIVTFITVTASGFNESIRITAASSVLALILAFPAYHLFSDKPSSPLQKTVAAAYSLAALMQILRATAAVTTTLDMSLTSSSLVNTWLFVFLFLQMTAGNMGFILLAKEKQDAELIQAATIDVLTNSLNRRTFEKRATEMISLFTRRQEPVSCLLLDVDDFKKVNDGHGHLKGDAVLHSIAATIRQQLRDYDLFGRYGGEEFVVLVPGTNSQQALAIADRIKTAVEEMRMEGSPDIRCTVSIGVSTILPDRQTTTESFYRISDRSLYLAKQRGKNQVASD